MNKEFSLVWSFRNSIDVLIESIKSAHQYCPKRVNFCLVDAASDEDQIKKLREFCNTIEDRKIRICESAFRTTLWEAWNLGFMLTETRWVIFSSSDVLFTGDAWLRNIVSEQGIIHIHDIYYNIKNNEWVDATYAGHHNGQEGHPDYSLFFIL